MPFLKKRETPIQNIAYIGIMSAVNVVFVLISSLLPILFILLVFILPLTSVIVTIYCKKRYFPVYFITTLALCFGVTAGFSIFDTFIYILPSLIVGFLFGFLIEKRVPAIYVLLINVIAQFLLTYLTFLILDKAILKVNFFNSIYNMIGLAEFAFKGVLTIIFTYIVAQIQIVITYIFVKYEVSRIGIELNLAANYRFILYIVTLFSGILTVLSLYFFKEAALLLTLVSLPIIIYELFDLCFQKSVLLYVLIDASIIIFAFLFAFTYQYIPSPNQLSLLYIFFALITIIDLIFNYCLNRKVKTIE